MKKLWLAFAPNGLAGMLRDRGNAVFTHKGWKLGNPNRN
jgi:hypothetical protein